MNFHSCHTRIKTVFSMPNPLSGHFLKLTSSSHWFTTFWFLLQRGLTKALEAISGASIKQYAHYGQNIRDSKFRKWNYSPLKNLIKYGTLTPPEYDLSLVTANITMHYTVGDVLLHEQDVLDMAKVMPNTKVRRIARDTFSHFDFVLASDSRELVHDYIVKRLSKKYE